MKRFFLLIILTFLLLGHKSYCQDDSRVHYECYDKLLNDCDNLLGYACGFGGMQSETVQMMEVLIKAYRIDLLKELLYSKYSAVQYISCMVLMEEQFYEDLDQRFLDRIQQIKTSHDLVNYCSGCTISETKSLISLCKENANSPIVSSTHRFIKDALN